MTSDFSQAIPLCPSADLQDGGLAVPFDVLYAGQTSRAFAIRFQGRAHAYLNRCAHVPMEMDYQENRFFDDSGRWLLCATHGATYAPDTGTCVAGPCRGGGECAAGRAAARSAAAPSPATPLPDFAFQCGTA